MNAASPAAFLVRHGQTEWSLQGRHTGRTDLPLTARGEDDARLLAPRLRRHAFAEVLCSPLLRARRTAELAGFAGRLTLDDDLMEWDYGAYEGRRTVDIRAERPGWSLYADGCPRGETAADVALRADRVIGRIRGATGDVLVFAHRDLLRVLAVRWVALPARDGRLLQLDTTSISILGYDHEPTEPVVRAWNEPPRAAECA